MEEAENRRVTTEKRKGEEGRQGVFISVITAISHECVIRLKALRMNCKQILDNKVCLKISDLA